jgi:hypothetical protein
MAEYQQRNGEKRGGSGSGVAKNNGEMAMASAAISGESGVSEEIRHRQ